MRFWIRPDANSLAGFGSVGANYFAGIGTVRMQIILPDSDPFRIRICMINSESLSGRQLSFFLQKIHKKKRRQVKQNRETLVMEFCFCLSFFQ